jgi:hypothetical protein
MHVRTHAHTDRVTCVFTRLHPRCLVHGNNSILGMCENDFFQFQAGSRREFERKSKIETRTRIFYARPILPLLSQFVTQIAFPMHGSSCILLIPFNVWYLFSEHFLIKQFKNQFWGLWAGRGKERFLLTCWFIPTLSDIKTRGQVVCVLLRRGKSGNLGN